MPASRVRVAPVEGAAELFTPEFTDFLLALHGRLGGRVHDLIAKRAAMLARAHGAGRPLPARHRDLRPLLDRQHVHQRAQPGPEGERAEGDLDDDEDSGGHRLIDTVRAAHNRLAAVHRELHFTDTERGRDYRIAEGELPFFMHRERGLHLFEPDVTVDGAPVSAAILGTALTLFYAGRARRGRVLLPPQARDRGGGETGTATCSTPASSACPRFDKSRCAGSSWSSRCRASTSRAGHRRRRWRTLAIIPSASRSPPAPSRSKAPAATRAWSSRTSKAGSTAAAPRASTASPASRAFIPCRWKTSPPAACPSPSSPSAFCTTRTRRRGPRRRTTSHWSSAYSRKKPTTSPPACATANDDKSRATYAEAETRYRKSLKIALRWIKNYTTLDFRSLASYTRADLDRIAVVRNPPARDVKSKPRDGVVWVLKPNTDDFVDIATKETPFEGERTRIFRPAVIARRIATQAGVFTVHELLAGKRFVALERNRLFSAKLAKIHVPARAFAPLRREPHSCGVNYASMFPDLDGACQHLTWRYTWLEDER